MTEFSDKELSSASFFSHRVVHGSKDLLVSTFNKTEMNELRTCVCFRAHFLKRWEVRVMSQLCECLCTHQLPS